MRNINEKSLKGAFNNYAPYTYDLKLTLHGITVFNFVFISNISVGKLQQCHFTNE